MSDEKKSLTEKIAAAQAKPAKKKGRGPIAGIKKWFREMRSELRKVIWSTKKQVFNNTLISLGFMGVAAIVLWGFDSVAQLGVRTLISLVG